VTRDISRGFLLSSKTPSILHQLGRPGALILHAGKKDYKSRESMAPPQICGIIVSNGRSSSRPSANDRFNH
jgi:hypothetical protein